ncbi:MAG TPA: pitrilysin family protein [Blastocatellia bacterium]|nr:pitrilysin family protein [Blastocatellia bacterium]
MKSLKYTITFCLVVALVSICAIPALAQNDSKKKKDVQSEVIAPAPPTPFSGVKRDALLNGMQVVSLARAGDGRLRCDLVVRSGAMFDLVYKAGLAKLTQESLLAANPNLVGELESLQAKIEWGVTPDHTWFRIDSPTGNFATVMEIIGRLLVVENVRQDAFKRAQQAQLEKLRQGSAPNPAERADAKFLSEIYGDHPYGHNVDGTEKSVASIVWADVHDFYRRFYLANNAVAVVTGDVNQERALSVFRAFFGGWVKGAIVPMTFRQPQRVTTLKLVRVEAPEMSTVEFRGGVIGVRQADPDFIATALLARVLEARLRKDNGDLPAGGVSVRAVPHALAGPFYIAASVNADRAPEFSRKATESFAALATAPFTAEELAAARDGLNAEYAARPIEDQLREIETSALPRNHALTFSGRVTAVTTADLQRVARRLLDANALTVVVLGRTGEQSKAQTSNP